MTVDWAAFTPLSAAIGGALLGLAATMLLLLNGRVAGVSNIIGGLLRPVPTDVAWRVAFLAGLLLAPAAYALYAPAQPVAVDASYAVLIVAGLLVGIGTRYGSGCTSGHGICGLSRLSARSLVATALFMAAGFATVLVARHLVP